VSSPLAGAIHIKPLEIITHDIANTNDMLRMSYSILELNSLFVLILLFSNVMLMLNYTILLISPIIFILDICRVSLNTRRSTYV